MQRSQILELFLCAAVSYASKTDRFEKFQPFRLFIKLVWLNIEISIATSPVASPSPTQTPLDISIKRFPIENGVCLKESVSIGFWRFR